VQQHDVAEALSAIEFSKYLQGSNGVLPRRDVV
jgi:hypothetical protein